MNGLTLLVGMAMVAGSAVAVYGWERWESRRVRRSVDLWSRLAAIPDLERPGVSVGTALPSPTGGCVDPDVRAIRPRTVTTDRPGWPHR